MTDDLICINVAVMEQGGTPGWKLYYEVMASEVAQRILGQDAIPYQLVRLHGNWSPKMSVVYE